MILLKFLKGRNGGVISFLPSGKVVLVDKRTTFKIQPTEWWVGEISEKEKFCIFYPSHKASGKDFLKYMKEEELRTLLEDLRYDKNIVLLKEILEFVEFDVEFYEFDKVEFHAKCFGVEFNEKIASQIWGERFLEKKKAKEEELKKEKEKEKNKEKEFNNLVQELKDKIVKNKIVEREHILSLDEIEIREVVHGGPWGGVYVKKPFSKRGVSWNDICKVSSENLEDDFYDFLHYDDTSLKSHKEYFEFLNEINSKYVKEVQRFSKEVINFLKEKNISFDENETFVRFIKKSEVI